MSRKNSSYNINQNNKRKGNNHASIMLFYLYFFTYF